MKYLKEMLPLLAIIALLGGYFLLMWWILKLPPEKLEKSFDYLKLIIAVCCVFCMFRYSYVKVNKVKFESSEIWALRAVVCFVYLTLLIVFR